jgi:hypothetical protein
MDLRMESFMPRWRSGNRMMYPGWLHLSRTRVRQVLTSSYVTITGLRGFPLGTAVMTELERAFFSFSICLVLRELMSNPGGETKGT